MNNAEIARLTDMLINEEITMEEYDRRYAELVSNSHEDLKALAKRQGATTDEEEVTPKKKSHHKKKEGTGNSDEDKPVPKKKIDYAELVSINVHVPEHNIHYKEQDWPVCERNLTYSLRRVSVTKREVDIMKEVGFEREEGVVYRVYEIVTYDKITNDLTRIGYVIRSSKKKVFTFLNIELLKKHQINISKVEKSLKKELQNQLQRAVAKKQSKEVVNQ